MGKIGERKQGVPAQVGSAARLLPPPFWGTEINRRVDGGRPYAPPNSGPTRPVAAIGPPLSLQPQPPPSFPLEYATHGLTALRGTEPLQGAPAGAREVLVAPRAVARKTWEIFCWALTLAVTRHVLTGRLGVIGWGRIVFRLAALGTPTPIALALGLSLGAAVGGLTIPLAGSLFPPEPSCGSARGATVSGLGVGGSKERLASLEQTTSLAGLMSPLTGPRIAASWIWAQGSCELPTAKPRTRSPLRLSLIHI